MTLLWPSLREKIVKTKKSKFGRIDSGFSFLTLLKVLSKDECEKSFDIDQIAKSGIPKFIIDQQFPDGIRKELACVDNHLHVEKACQVINQFLIQYKNPAIKFLTFLLSEFVK
jgi:hypothetical protein